MKLQHLKIALLVLCMSLFSGGFAQGDSQVSQYLSTDNDLSNNSVNAIFEDSRGVTWIGTSLGLNRYDGYEIKVYKNRLGKNQLCSDRIYCISEDCNARLWLGTNVGVEIFDVDMRQILNIQSRSTTNSFIESTQIVAIEPSDDGRTMICATQNHGLLIYCAETTQLIRNDNDRWVDIVAFKPLDANHYLVATKERLSIYDIRSGKSRDIEGIVPEIGSVIRDFDTTPTSIYLTLTKGVRRVDYSPNVVTGEFNFEVNPHLYYPDERFDHIYVESGGKLFLSGGRAGLFMLPSLDSFGGEREVVDLSVNVTYISEMKSGRYLWLGTRHNGVYRLNNHNSIFQTLKFSAAPNFRLSYISRYDDDNIIVKSTTSKCFLYDVRNKRVKQHSRIDNLPMTATPFTLPNGDLYALDCNTESNRLLISTDSGWCEVAHRGDETLPKLVCSSVWVDECGEVWFSSKERLSRLQVQDRLSRLQIVVEGGVRYYTIQRVDLPVVSSRLQKIRALAFDRPNRRVWVGTANQGLYQINNVDSTQITPSQIIHLYNDEEYNDDDELESIPSNFISAMSICADELYIGNFMGLFRGRMEGDKCIFKIYTTEAGLPNEAIKGIAADGDNRLFISSVRGITIFEPRDDRFYNYELEDGLPFYSFSDHIILLNDNSIVMSTVSEAVEFNPNKLTNSKPIPNIEFGELRVFNKRIDPGDVVDGKVAVKRRLMDRDTIQLSYKRNTISVDIHLLHYGNPQRYSVRYRIGDAQDRNGVWLHRTSNNMTLSFNNLKHGKYGLEIAGSNSNGEWGESKRITIIIDPPFWLTWWAWLIYVIAVLLLIYTVMRFILHLQSLQHTIEIENVSKREEMQKQLYISNIAHEIKTPLSMVVSTADTLYEQYNHDSDISKQLRFVQRQSYKISNMIETVQSIYLNELGFLRPKLSVFEFSEFINPIVEDFRHLSTSQQKSLSAISLNDKVYVKADNSMLERIIHNLLNNAHKYTHKGGAIEFKWSVENNELIIKVKDDGIGIAPEEIGRIFERYYRSDAVRNQNIVAGTGIGLDFSRQLVELHGGKIAVESQLSEGSCFTINLPIVTDGVDSSVDSSEQGVSQSIIVDQIDQLAPLGDVQSEFSDSLIFIVEDNEELRSVMVNFVGRYYRVMSYADGAEALKAMDDLCPDLILSDVNMPNIDGYEFCQRVKSGIATSHIPIILITACTSIEEKIRCREVGADIYISKPFYPKYVIACIETTFRNHKSLRERFRIGTPVEATSDIESEKSNEFLEKFYGLLDENLSNEDIDLKLIARKMYLNRTYFYQKVKAMTNMTPYEFIKEYRLIKAAEMLCRGEKSILEICFDTGFKNRTHFSRIFKERFGVTPSRYNK